ncbi:MAG: hypothetical protein EPN98_21395 [Phenylobacterium sp.]|uniref:hypothetical protein n=1 Tax=Phenylobacterium sp. TaxID=1871053 RepID=UPI00120E3BFF|nr:hypothetical protein [Phenylobacterium sp.]TAL29000.1 MAG: hypothetical protein EPN98_21395 [Phenylobacterium sp.]
MATPRKRRKNGKPSKPRGGQSTRFREGNKAAKGHGRPKIPAEYKAALKILEPAALSVLDEVLADADHPRREQAAEYIINRARGTPRTRTEVSTPPGKPLEVDVKERDPKEMTSGERKRLIAKLTAELADREGGDADHGREEAEPTTGDIQDQG